MTKEAFKTIHGNEYETPSFLFDALNAEFSFTFDLACTAKTAKCEKYFSLAEGKDSLKMRWHDIPGWLWLNPPYSPLKPWIVKAQEENARGAKIVILCPPIISTRYFQARLPSEIRFILGRIPFLLDDKLLKSNTSDSALLIYDTKVYQPKCSYVERAAIERAWRR